MTYDFQDLTFRQQELLTFGGWTPDSKRPQPGPATVRKLIARGLLEEWLMEEFEFQENVSGGRFRVTIKAYTVPIEENDRLQARLERAEAAVENLSEQAKAAHDVAHAIGMDASTSVTDLPSAVRGLLEQNGKMRGEIEAAMNKTDCATGLRFRPIIPEAVMRRCERPYAGPVKPGDVFAWEPDIDTARELLVVTRITKELGFIESYEERVFTRPIDGGKEVWNDMGRFREAVVPTLFRPWQVDTEERS